MTTEDASPQLTWTEEGEPRSGRFGDVYFSRDDGLAETRAVFLQGCGLPEAWAGRRSFTVAGAVRRGLAERGFVVDKRPGHGRKRERLEARLPGQATPQVSRPRVAIVGAGMAGASAARALAAAGLQPVVIEAERPGAGGSGFPVGLVTPRLDAGDADVAALYAQALERAGQLYGDVEDAVVARGVLQTPQAPRDVARFDRIAAQPIWPPDAMTILSPRQASDWLGEPMEEGGLLMAQALVVRPLAVLDAWLAGVDRRTGQVKRLERAEEGWRLVASGGEVIAEADIVILAGGWGAASLLDRSRHPELTPVRGQADWVEGPSVGAVAWGGYAAPTGQGVLFGATHDRDRTDLAVRPEDSARNRDTLRSRTPALADRVEAASGAQARVAVRATTADRLPIAGWLDDGLLMLGGLGSRGLCLAPLLGEHLAALALGLPSPLPRALAGRVRPDRPALRPKVGPRT